MARWRTSDQTFVHHGVCMSMYDKNTRLRYTWTHDGVRDQFKRSRQWYDMYVLLNYLPIICMDGGRRTSVELSWSLLVGGRFVFGRGWFLLADGGGSGVRCFARSARGAVRFFCAQF